MDFRHLRDQSARAPVGWYRRLPRLIAFSLRIMCLVVTTVGAAAMLIIWPLSLGRSDVWALHPTRVGDGWTDYRVLTVQTGRGRVMAAASIQRTFQTKPPSWLIRDYPPGRWNLTHKVFAVQSADEIGWSDTAPRRLGFRYQPIFSQSRDATGQVSVERRGLRLASPAWALLVIFAAYPLAILCSALRRRQRRRRCLCVSCGYDLRASPGRCPECGRAATNR